MQLFNIDDTPASMNIGNMKSQYPYTQHKEIQEELDYASVFELLPEVPVGAVVVSESGIGSRAQLDELERAGVHAVLVGEALLRAPDPEAACRALLARE